MAKEKSKKQTQAMAVLTSRETVEYYTPSLYVELARHVLGEIDLDPASAAFPQTWIKAREFYTEEDDGLKLAWHGRVFLNPPYDKTPLWVKKLEQEFNDGRTRAAVLLINAHLGYDWYEAVWRRYPVCHMRKRISFIRADGDSRGEAKHAQCFFLLSRFPFRREMFAKAFGRYGRVLLP